MSVSSCPPLDHLDRMTDHTGLIQHAIYSVPRRESGYTTDDNARALRLCARLFAHQSDERMLQRVTCYLSFLEYARCANGGFHNFMSYQREWLDDAGCGDCQGQAVLALAETLVSDLPQGVRSLSHELIDGVIPVLASLTSLRAHAYVVQAWAVLSRANIASVDALKNVARHSVDRLVDAWNHSQRCDWQWFEPQMTYANAVLPHALFDAAERWSNEELQSIAERSFEFLETLTTTDTAFWPIGNDGWNGPHAEQSRYDQQPVEASTMAAAAMAALQFRHDENYLTTFRKAHSWFHGQNSLQYEMADFESGGCLDGLQSTGVNYNQGAESTLALLWTEVLAMELNRNSTTWHGVPLLDAELLELPDEVSVH